MVVSKFHKLQIESNQKELVSQLQKEAQQLFYDRMMYDINDSLTSILAICDVEAKGVVPKVKEYIHRINKSLHNTKSYQKSTLDKKFNINLVLRNLMRVIDENYVLPKKAALLSEIKASVQGSQSHFEQLFLHIFVNLFPEGNQSDADILIELRQKDQNAMLTIIKDDSLLASDALERIDEVIKESKFGKNTFLKTKESVVEITIKVPIIFEPPAFSQETLTPPKAKKAISPESFEITQQGYRTADVYK